MYMLFITSCSEVFKSQSWKECADKACFSTCRKRYHTRSGSVYKFNDRVIICECYALGGILTLTNILYKETNCGYHSKLGY